LSNDVGQFKTIALAAQRKNILDALVAKPFNNKEEATPSALDNNDFHGGSKPELSHL